MIRALFAAVLDRRGSHALSDLARLRDLIEAKLRTTAVGERFEIGPDYSPSVTHPLRFEVREANFDPAAADPSLW